MFSRKQMSAFSPSRPMPLANLCAVLLAGIGALVDWTTGTDFNVPIVYSVPLVFAAATRNRRLLWGLTLLMVCATFIVYSVQMAASTSASIAPGAGFLSTPLFIDRVLAAATMVITAAILDSWTHALDVLDVNDRSMKEQNERLKATNLELLFHKEGITAKNEELDRRRREVEEISSRKTLMLASMSHDIRTPMQAIIMMAEVISRTATSPDHATRIPRLAQRLQANALAVVDLLSKVIDISSFDSGLVTVNDSEFTLDELLAEQCQRLLPMAEGKGIRLERETSVPGLRLRTDRVKLDRILSNLMSNAIKFTDSGAVTVSIGLGPEGGALIRVQDTGRGIASEDLDRLFDEFAQFHGSRRTTGGGWGLGLAISRRLSQLIGGKITIETQLDKGSAFTVVLTPACTAASPHTGASAQ